MPTPAQQYAIDAIELGEGVAWFLNAENNAPDRLFAAYQQLLEPTNSKENPR